jgi:hypothetical protein
MPDFFLSAELLRIQEQETWKKICALINAHNFSPSENKISHDIFLDGNSATTSRDIKKISKEKSKTCVPTFHVLQEFSKEQW